jgi:Flp pilus assembly protein TadD
MTVSIAIRSAALALAAVCLAATAPARAAGYPNENDLLTWHKAFERAPQITAIRLGYAHAMIEAGETDNALPLLTPLANGPHGGREAEIAQAMIEHARSGDMTEDLEGEGTP